MITYSVITGLCDEMIDPRLPKSTEAGSPLQGLNQWLSAGLAAEPQDADVASDLSLRGPITRWLGLYFGDPRMLPSVAASKLPLEPGDPNPFFAVIDAIKREGGQVNLGSGPTELASAFPVSRAEWQQIGYCIALVVTGGDVTGMQVYFEISDLSAEVPASFPNRTYSQFDEANPEAEPTEVTHTWATWYGGMPGHDPIEIGGQFYCSSANTWDRGRPLAASAWALLVAAQSLVVKSVAEVQAMQPAPSE